MANTNQVGGDFRWKLATFDNPVILPAHTEFINIAYMALYYKQIVQLFFQSYQTLYIWYSIQLPQ